MEIHGGRGRLPGATSTACPRPARASPVSWRCSAARSATFLRAPGARCCATRPHFSAPTTPSCSAREPWSRTPRSSRPPTTTRRASTAEFNRNVLHVMNRELGADFAPDAFDHVAFFDRRREWVEMRLRAQRPMTVRVADLDLQVEFAAGEELPHRDQREIHPASGWSATTLPRGSSCAAGTSIPRSCSRSPWPPGAIGSRAAMQVEGSSAIVFGGASGLGEASARRLHEHGARVTIADLNEDKGGALADALGDEASFVKTDVDPGRRGRGGCGRCGPRPRAACESTCAVRASAGPRSSPASAAPHQLQPFETGDRHQPDRHVQRPALRRSRHARQRSERRGRARRVRQQPTRRRPMTARSASSPTRPRRAGSWA